MNVRSLALALAAGLLLAVAAPSLPASAKPAPKPRISMNVSGADLRQVLSKLAAKMGRNLYLHPDVQGQVTLQVQDVSAEGAFGLCLQMQTEEYTYKIVDNTILVATPEKLAEIPDDILSP